MVDVCSGCWHVSCRQEMGHSYSPPIRLQNSEYDVFISEDSGASWEVHPDAKQGSTWHTTNTNSDSNFDYEWAGEGRISQHAGQFYGTSDTKFVIGRSEKLSDSSRSD